MSSNLGRGLNSLIREVESDDKGKTGISTLPVGSIKPNRLQPRKYFDNAKLQELAESIKQNGIIQPLIVTKTEGEDYELIAGERRLQAARLAGMSEVPVVIRSVSKKEQFQLAIIENIQREDLSPIEEALAYRDLSEMFDLTHAQIAEIVGKDRATVSNSIRLLKLPEKIRELIVQETITPGHARAILSIEEEYQEKFAEYIVRYKLSVRQAEEKSKTFVLSLRDAARKPVKTDIVHSFMTEMKRRFQSPVSLKDKGGKGKIVFEYRTPEELETIIKKLTDQE
ncbi:MAG: ParB/RepB/Spo0J family partition protein [Candidatus Cloacimonadaceae bacterium]|nr:ParB/RepB/Spo0J family partition protein [Candidatus Cloacimonadaceae bacterium]